MTTVFSKDAVHPVFIEGPQGRLEAMTAWPTSMPAKPMVALICHPHPLHGGTMLNKVVTTLAKAFDIMGLPTCRFNYRGVGDSAGTYGDMTGEVQDGLAVVDWLAKALPDYQLLLAGFSFGSYIAASIANQQLASQLVTIAPAVNHADFTQLTHIQCPWLIVQGESDEIVPAQQVMTFAENSPLQPQLVLMPETTHFFHGQLIALRELLLTHVKLL